MLLESLTISIFSMWNIELICAGSITACSQPRLNLASLARSVQTTDMTKPKPHKPRRKPKRVPKKREENHPPHSEVSLKEFDEFLAEIARSGSLPKKK